MSNFAIGQTRGALTRASQQTGLTVTSILNTVMDTKETPPTFHKTNKFTQGFQNIVDAYGVANYKEVNPTPFTIITFPFLFAVMFGDAGHGLIMTMTAFWLIAREKQLIISGPKSDFFETFFGGRYIIFLMGLFSIYTGLIYNDVFGKSMNLFGSSWTVNSRDPTQQLDYSASNASVALDPQYNLYNETYPFGVDPIWSLATNKIQFLNSFKMKLSILLGVSHMLFGTCLSFFNALQFRKPLDILCEVVPQILFMACLFGYLSVLIIFKWLYFSYENVNDAPNVLIVMIDMFMSMGKVKGKEMYEGQQSLQTVLLLFAFVSVPWMLLIKPLALWVQAADQKKKNISLEQVVTGTCDPCEDEFSTIDLTSNGFQRRNKKIPHKITYSLAGPLGDGEVNIQIPDMKFRPSVSSNVSTAKTEEGHENEEEEEEEEEEFSLGEAFIYQAINSIEYCLGAVSNAASYLRLWALSLAHAQLSEVL